MLAVRIFLAALFASASISCGTMWNEGERIAEDAKNKAARELEEQSQKVVDKVFPPFDHDKPDTENNRQRFRDFLKVELTPDVKNIYCFDDAIGIDASYMFGFNCDPATSEKIIEMNDLKIDTAGTAVFTPQYEFKWWNDLRVACLQRYSWTDGQQYFKYYWYDANEKKAYFFDFDM